MAVKNPRSARAERVGPDWPVAALAVAGLALSTYLTWTKLARASALFCEAGSACDVVQSSRYAVFLGVPTAAWGAALYVVVAGLAIMGLPPRRWVWTFVLAVSAVSFSAYLTYLELFVIKAICPYCLGVAGVAVALLATLLVRRPVSSSRRAPTRTPRLVALGLTTAVLTVVVGAGVFAAGSAPELAYQEALARHLAATGAVMYGAYW